MEKDYIIYAAANRGWYYIVGSKVYIFDNYDEASEALEEAEAALIN